MYAIVARETRRDEQRNAKLTTKYETTRNTRFKHKRQTWKNSAEQRSVQDIEISLLLQLARQDYIIFELRAIWGTREKWHDLSRTAQLWLWLWLAQLNRNRNRVTTTCAAPRWFWAIEQLQLLRNRKQCRNRVKMTTATRFVMARRDTKPLNGELANYDWIIELWAFALAVCRNQSVQLFVGNYPLSAVSTRTKPCHIKH